LQIMAYSDQIQTIMTPIRGILLAFAIAALVFLPNPALTASAPLPADPPSQYDQFILYRGNNGDTVCRKATELDATQLNNVPLQDLRQINHLGLKSGPRPEDLPSHLTIILRATANLDANAAAKAAFVRAAEAWESRITSPVTIYIDVDYGPTNFGAAWPDQVLGSTSSPSLSNVNYDVVRNRLIAIASTPSQLAVYNALPANSLPIDTGAGSATSLSVSSSIARAIGLLNPTADSTDNAAKIGFNSQLVTYDFDPSDGTVGTDFQSVATHEIGHALGFTSRSGIPNATIPAMWDLYRFRSGTTSGTFTTALRIMTIGGSVPNSQYYFVPGQTETGLSNGGPDPDNDPNKSTDNSDGNQSSHWRQQSLNGGVLIGIMDPRIPGGIARPITDADIGALNIFGYNSNIVPQTPPPNDNFASAQVIAGCSGSVSGTNVGATHEPGEPNHSPDNGGGTRSVWYQWQAPASGNATVTTKGSQFDTVLGVYQGTAVNALAPVPPVGKDDDSGGADHTSVVTFTATAGQTYRIAVDGYNNNGSGGDVGPITLNWSIENCGAAPLELILEESGPFVNQASALDAILFVRDPFPVVNSANLFSLPGDPNTKVLIFVTNLQLAQGETAAAVTVNLIDSLNQTYNIPAQDVRSVPNQAFTQVTFRLPSNLPVGTCQIKVIAHGLTSNTATLRIKS